MFPDLRFPYTIFTLQTSFKPLLLKGVGGGGRGGVKSKISIEVTVKSKEEDFWANYAQEFGIRKAKMAHPTKAAECFL